jgi:hypothetical protein
MNRLVHSGFIITPVIALVDEETDTAQRIEWSSEETSTGSGLADFAASWPQRWDQARAAFAAQQRDAEALAAVADPPPAPPRAARRARPVKKAAKRAPKK